MLLRENTVYWLRAQLLESDSLALNTRTQITTGINQVGESPRTHALKAVVPNSWCLCALESPLLFFNTKKTGPHPGASYLVGVVWNSWIYISNMFPGVAAEAFGAGTTPSEGTLNPGALNKLFSQHYSQYWQEGKGSLGTLSAPEKSPLHTLLQQS